MTEDKDNIEHLICDIRSRTKADLATSGAITLLNAIPYAGGAVASVIGDIAAQRRFEKVCDVLSDLNAKLEEHGAEPERHLSKDQIIEVVHETLLTVATASDEKKISALKNGLGYAFLADDKFERKQLFLQVLRGCTSIELAICSIIYEISDPYIIREGQRPDEQSLSVATVFTTPSGTWDPIGNRDECGQEPLITLLAKHVGFNEADTEVAIRILDGKGLTNAVTNLFRKDGKIVQWRAFQHGTYAVASVYPGSSVFRPQVQATPLEASRTKFGEDFIRFCKGY